MHGLPMILLDYRGKHTKNQPRIGAAALLSVKMSSVRAALLFLQEYPPPGSLTGSAPPAARNIFKKGKNHAVV